MQEERIRVGYVSSVCGSKMAGVLVGQEEMKFDDGRLTEAVQIGALVKIRTARSVAFGIVNGLAIRQPTSPPAPENLRTVEIDLFGEVVDAAAGGSSFTMQRGVSVYPGLGQSIYAATSQDLARIYAPPQGVNVQIGTLHQDPSLPACVAPDELLGKHLAILGTTGSGKSCAVALILQAVLREHANGHVVLLDPHDEYHHAFTGQAEIIGMDSLQLPYWLLSYEEAVEVMCLSDGPGRESESAILKEAMLIAKRAFLRNAEDARHVTVDTPTPYRLGAVIAEIDKSMGKLDRPETTLPYLRLKARLESLQADRRYAFMFSSVSVQDNMAEILSRILRVPVAGKPVTIIDLSGVPSEIVDVVVSSLCRMIFDFALWSSRAAAVPVLLVCEEAHRYIPQDQTLGFKPTRHAIARIAKEGRKYGVSLCLVTQRPSELSETILSQCNTLFALRMSNDQDQAFVRRALPDSAAGLLTALPALRTQEAVVVGEGVALPMRIRFAHLPEAQRPRSTTAPFSSSWQHDVDPAMQVEQVIRRWRQQSRPRPAQQPNTRAAAAPGPSTPGTTAQGMSAPGPSVSGPNAPPTSAADKTAAAPKTSTSIRKTASEPPAAPPPAPSTRPADDSPTGHAIRRRVTRVFGTGR